MVLTEFPLTPADCDLRGMPYMPLFGDRLFGSATWIAASADGKVAALRLWWRSFAHEVPAASLPDDDTLLADYAGYGVAVKAWRKVRPQAMRGWLLCTDGRLYHRVVAEAALEAWEQRKRNREKQEKWRKKNRSVTPPVTVTEGVTGPLRNAVSEVKEELSEGKNVTSTPCVADSAQARPPQPGRSTLIPISFQPTAEAIARLRKGRPDLVGEYFDLRMEAFRLWCRESAKTSHDPEATWLGFMIKSRAAPGTEPANGAPKFETFDQRRIREGNAIIDAYEANNP